MKKIDIGILDPHKRLMLNIKSPLSEKQLNELISLLHAFITISNPMSDSKTIDVDKLKKLIELSRKINQIDIDFRNSYLLFQSLPNPELASASVTTIMIINGLFKNIEL